MGGPAFRIAERRVDVDRHELSESVIARRPLLTLLAICGVSSSLACYAPLTGFPRYAAWAFVVTFSGYLWFLAYALTDCASGRGQKIPYQFGAFRSFWALGVVPVPEGRGYWRRIEAKTPEDLAVTMIKGVKLIVWCLLLLFVNRCYQFIVYEKLRIPYPNECLQAVLVGKPLPFVMNWVSWPADLFEEILSLAIRTHAFIAVCRMAGFRALRNTYARLASRTIAEYWNRYYYYFKELLVDMFFLSYFHPLFQAAAQTAAILCNLCCGRIRQHLVSFSLSSQLCLAFRAAELYLELSRIPVLFAFAGSWNLDLTDTFAQIARQSRLASRARHRPRLRSEFLLLRSRICGGVASGWHALSGIPMH